MNDEITTAVKRIIREKNQQESDDEFEQWCAHLDATDPNTKLTLNEDWDADIELQPHRWLSAGMDIIKSGLVLSRVRNMDGSDGVPLQCVLPYPIFLSGTELFLKGMILCQYPECRRVAQIGYADTKKRRKYDVIVREYGHNLPALIAANRQIKQHKSDKVCMRFLERLDALVRIYYFPLFASDQNHGWSIARYPKRFYDDHFKKGSADGLKIYPPHDLVVRLFEQMERYLNRKWRLRLTLLDRRKAKHAKREANKATRTVQI